MPFDGVGFFTRVHNWTADKLASVKIQAGRMDAEDDGFADAFNETFLRNGIVPMAGDLKLGGNHITGIAQGSAGVPAISFTGDPSTGIFQPSPGEMSFSVMGVEGGKITGDGLLVAGFGINTLVPRTPFDIKALASIRGVFEDTAYSAVGISGTVNVDYLTQAVIIFDANAAGNFTFNVRGDGTHTLDSEMAINQTLTFTVEVPQGVTPYYCTAITVDGAAPAQIKWFGGAPAAGNASGIDVYSIIVFKKAANTFYVRASQQQAK